MTHPFLKNSNEPNAEDKKRILAKALCRMADRLNLSRQELSATLGPSESSLSRLFSKSTPTLDPDSKEGELAILLLRLYRSLDTLFGSNENHCQLWLRSENTHLNDKPLHLIQSIEGLVQTVQYFMPCSNLSQQGSTAEFRIMSQEYSFFFP